MASTCHAEGDSKADLNQEAKTATITLNDDDPQTVNRMFQYLYMLDYPGGDAPTVPAEPVAVNRYLPPHLRSETSESTDEGTAPVQPVASAAPHDLRMMSNVHVYSIAEKYDIPELKELAKDKFLVLASSKWPHDDFVMVADAVFSTTHDGDMGLRQIVLDICEEHFEEILKDKTSRAGFLDNSAIATVVLDAAVRKSEQNKSLLDGALAKQIAQEEEISDLKDDVQEAVAQKNAKDLFFDTICARTDQVTECRHCHQSFHWSLERAIHLGGHGAQLRCRDCRTKAVL